MHQVLQTSSSEAASKYMSGDETLHNTKSLKIVAKLKKTFEPVTTNPYTLM